MSPRLRSSVSILFVALLGSSANAQQPDMQAMVRWAKADFIRYHIVGEYQARTDVIGSSNDIGYADVTDRVVIDLKWKLSTGRLVGPATFVNEASTTANLGNYDAKCQPPTLHGAYEHYTLLSVSDGLSARLLLNVQTTYPASEVVQFCSGRRKPVAGSSPTRTEELVMVSPVLLGMALPDSDTLRASKDGKSLVAKKNGWTWTYTPSIDPVK
jgi:hypothetical protein